MGAAQAIPEPIPLVASYVFYGSWDWRFLGLLLLSTVTDYFVARRLEGESEERRRRRLLRISLVVNLGILGSFKYFNFFIDSAIRPGYFSSVGYRVDGQLQPAVPITQHHQLFWRTWHISLSTWLRDYLYIPLGGNRNGKLMTYRNLMITMLLGGLWHGAGWTFVVWGGLHGVYLAVHRQLRHKSPKDATDSFTLRDVIPALVTFSLVCLAWVFFRAESFAQAFAVLEGILTLRPGPSQLSALTVVIVIAAIALEIDLIQRNSHSHTAVLAWPALARGAVYAALLLGIVIFAGGSQIPFMYFQF